MPAHCRMRAIDRDLIRGGHYGQRPCVPRLKAEHMAAPTNAANVKKALANSEVAVDGVLGLAGSTGWKVRWLRFRLTMERGPHERPQASEEKRSHEILCRVGRVDKRDQCLHRG